MIDRNGKNHEIQRCLSERICHGLQIQLNQIFMNNPIILKV